MLNRVVVAAGVVAGVGAGGWGQSSFTLIEPATGYTTISVRGVSANGHAVTGYSSTSGLGTTNSFVWTPTGGRLDFGTGLSNRPAATGISGDGQTVVGVEFDTARIFRWSAAGGYQSITGMAGYEDTFVSAVSGDGSVIGGQARNGGSTTPPVGPAVRWTQVGGYQNLGTLPGGGLRVDFGGMSRDGNTIVGTNSQSGFGNLHAYIWTAQSGMQPLEPTVNSPFEETEGRAVSGNGLVAFGNGHAAGVTNPFRWTVESGIIDLGRPNGVARPGTATYTNFDGTLAVCDFDSGGDFVWQTGVGYTSFETFLAQAGVLLPSGYTGLDITGLSDDGRTFVGGVTLPGVGRRGFVAVVPAPAGAAVITAGLAATMLRGRRGLNQECVA